MAAQTWRNLAFKDVFWKFSPRWLIQRKVKKKNSFYHIPWFKRLVVLKTDKRCHDIRWTGTVRDFCKLWL